VSPFHFCLSAAKNLSSFQLLPASLIADLLQLFLDLPLFLFPRGFHSRAAFGIVPSSLLNVWPIHLNFLFLISTFISSCPVTFHRSLLKIIFGHHILNIYLRHLFTKVCILRWISFVTSQASQPYKSTDFTHFNNKRVCKCFRAAVFCFVLVLQMVAKGKVVSYVVTVLDVVHCLRYVCCCRR